MAARKLIVLALAVPIVASTLASPVGAQLSDEEAFPGPDEVASRMAEFHEHPWINVTQVGESNEERPIHVAEVVDPNATTPRDERAVTLILTQQHGNEPAGTPAALRLLTNVTEGGPVTDRLDEQVLLVLPMVNPDGAAEFTRGNADGVDINRDHIGLETPEAKAVHRVINQWDVDVALDHHEYGGFGTGNPVPARIYDYDLLTLYPVHDNPRAPTVDAAKALMYEGIWSQVRQEGYSVDEYGEVTADGRPVTKIAGGPDPGILRNHYGLHNVAGLLIETRVDPHPNPFHTPERRIQIQHVVMDAATRYVDQHADRFATAKDASESLAVQLPAQHYKEGDSTGPLAEAYELPNTTEVHDTMTRHGIDPGQAGGDVLLHDAVHPLRGHAAAIFHPASSRNIVEGTATELPGETDDRELETASTDDNETPLGAASLLAALGVALAVTRVRRQP